MVIVAMDSRQQAQLTKILEDDDGDEPVDEDLLSAGAGHAALELFPSSPLVESSIIDSSSDIYKNLAADYQQQQQQHQQAAEQRARGPPEAASPATPAASSSSEDAAPPTISTTTGEPEAGAQPPDDDGSSCSRLTAGGSSPLGRPEPAGQGSSKYRRSTANARERIRMREINQAFEKLKRVVPIELMQGLGVTSSGDESDCHQVISTSVGGGRRVHSPQGATDQQPKLTKINTLRLAISYISKLSEVLESHPENGADGVPLASPVRLLGDGHTTEQLAPDKRSARKRRRSTLAKAGDVNRVLAINRKRQNRGLNQHQEAGQDICDVDKIKILARDEKLRDNTNNFNSSFITSTTTTTTASTTTIATSLNDYSDIQCNSNKSIDRGNFKLVQLIEPNAINSKHEQLLISHNHDQTSAIETPTKLILSHQQQSPAFESRHQQQQQMLSSPDSQANIVKLAPSFVANFRQQQQQQPAPSFLLANHDADQRQLPAGQRILIASPSGQLVTEYPSRQAPVSEFLAQGAHQAGDRTFVTPIAVAILGIQTTGGAARGQQAQQLQLLGLPPTPSHPQQAPQQVTLALNELNGLSLLRLAAPGGGGAYPQYAAGYQQPMGQQQMIPLQCQPPALKQQQLELRPAIDHPPLASPNKPPFGSLKSGILESEEDAARGLAKRTAAMVQQTPVQQPKRILRWHNYDGNMITNHLYNGAGHQPASAMSQPQQAKTTN